MDVRLEALDAARLARDGRDWLARIEADRRPGTTETASDVLPYFEGAVRSARLGDMAGVALLATVRRAQGAPLLAGFAWLEPFDPPVPCVAGFSVHRAFRGRGIGAQIVQACVEYAARWPGNSARVLALSTLTADGRRRAADFVRAARREGVVLDAAAADRWLVQERMRLAAA